MIRAAGSSADVHASASSVAENRIEAGGVGTRTLGVDFGLRRTGLALSSGFAPLPLRVVPCEGDSGPDGRADAAREVARAAAGEGAAQIVLGMPLNSTGGEGEQATVTREFARVLAAAAAPLPVFLWDERFSTFEARGRGPPRRTASTPSPPPSSSRSFSTPTATRAKLRVRRRAGGGGGGGSGGGGKRRGRSQPARGGVGVGEAAAADGGGTAAGRGLERAGRLM